MAEEEAKRPQAFTVTQAMNAAKRGLEQIHLTVIGEVSEFTDKPGYKAIYFTVHDEGATMECLVWRDRYRASGVELQVGMLVELAGCFSCYPKKGSMQFSVSRIAVAGEGNLRMQVARLAEKLRVEGLMDPARKRRIPALPQRIAVVTSPRGKAVYDVMRTLRRRYPLGELYICGVPVEGPDAARHMIAGLEGACAARPAPDVILLVRGGGSYEALMPFNDEALARAVAACPIPVVTGIGHEPDNSICDMVGDRRCSTPTAAAEAVALSVEELQGKVNNATVALNGALSSCIESARNSLERLSDRQLFKDDRYLTGGYYQELDLAGERLARAIPDALAKDAHTLDSLAQKLALVGPARIAAAQAEVQALHARLVNVGAHVLEQPRAAHAMCAAKLEALSPLKVLSRGYSITYAADERAVVRSVDDVAVGDDVFVQLHDGRLACTVASSERQN